MIRRLVETQDELATLGHAWDGLPGATTNPLLSHDWFHAASGILHREQRLQVATVWRGESLVAAAPLVEVRRGITRWLEFIGSTQLYEPCDVLFRDADALGELARYLVSLRRPLALHRVPADGALATALRAAGSGSLMQGLGSPCRRVDLSTSFDAYLAGRSRECRAGFPRKRRQLAADGMVTFESLTPDPVAADALLDEFVGVEASSWKLAAGSALGARPRMEEFFREVSHRFAVRGQLWMCFLRCGGHTAAAQLGLLYAGRAWELKVGYDARWRAASPGRLLLWEMIQDSHKRGLAAYEFLGAGDDQQVAWSTGERPLQTLVFYPHSIGGAAAAIGRTGSALVRRTTKALGRLQRRLARRT